MRGRCIENNVNIDRLIGATIENVMTKDELVGEDYFFGEVILAIKTTKGAMYFSRDDILGDEVFIEDGLDELKKMIGEEIKDAYESFNDDYQDDENKYTFYNISTHNYSTSLRFYLTWNNYYSESMTLYWEENQAHADYVNKFFN